MLSGEGPSQGQKEWTVPAWGLHPPGRRRRAARAPPAPHGRPRHGALKPPRRCPARSSAPRRGTSGQDKIQKLLFPPRTPLQTQLAPRPSPTTCHSLAPFTARPPWGSGHGVKGQVLRRAPWVLCPRAWVAGGGWPVGVPGGPVCPPQSLGVLEGILDGIEVNGTEAKQGGVWVRPRGEQYQVTRWKAKKKERPMFPENQHVRVYP